MHRGLVGRNTVAVVSPNAALRARLRAWLADAAIAAIDFESMEQLISCPTAPPLACVDAALPTWTAPASQHRLRRAHPQLVTIVIAENADGTVVTPASPLSAEAPAGSSPDGTHVLSAVHRTLWQQAQRDGGFVASGDLDPGSDPQPPPLVGNSQSILRLRQEIQRVADSDLPVFISGESGTGKELVARALHRQSGRRGPFVALNCAAIPSTLQDAELFGYERGAFTGALRQHKGRFEEAEGGTLFLDEVGEMAPATQALLLRTLQEKVIRRVGAMSAVRVNTRVLSATNRDLEAEVRAGRFRRDLCFRLVVYPLQVPPLRDRADDLPQLVEHMIRRYASPQRPHIVRVAEAAMQALVQHSWPGNVRELENIIRRALLHCDGDTLDIEHLPAELRAIAPEPTPAPVASAPTIERVLPLAEVERRAISEALQATSGNVSAAAKLLQVGRATLYRRLQQLGLASGAIPQPSEAQGSPRDPDDGK